MNLQFDDSIPRAIVELKNGFSKGTKVTSFFAEVIPLRKSERVPIDTGALESLHAFAEANPIYFRSFDSEVSGVQVRVYEGDITSYWLASKKHDTSYQPFYPTWMLSAYALALGAKSLGFDQLVDIGSGDGRIAYCGGLLGMKSFGIEIDEDLANLQKRISSKTGINFFTIRADATRFDFRSMDLTNPMFFISGLPEMGEMLAQSVINQAASIPALRNCAGFNFMGSHTMKALSRDQTRWGWGSVVSHFGLQVSQVVTLPTYWTVGQDIDTAYVYTRWNSLG